MYLKLKKEKTQNTNVFHFRMNLVFVSSGCTIEKKNELIIRISTYNCYVYKCIFFLTFQWNSLSCFQNIVVLRTSREKKPLDHFKKVYVYHRAGTQNFIIYVSYVSVSSRYLLFLLEEVSSLFFSFYESQKKKEKILTHTCTHPRGRKKSALRMSAKIN